MTVNQQTPRTIALLFMVLLQNIHVFNCRSESVSALKVPLRSNVILVFGVLAAQGIHIASMHLPFMQTILGTEPVRFTQWVLLPSLAMVIALVMENVTHGGCMRCPMESGRDGFALELAVQRTRTAQEQG